MAMPAERQKQFTHIKAARTDLLAWAAGNTLPLAHVDFVVPFVETDFSLLVWLFYATDLDVRQFEGDDTTQQVQTMYLSILDAGGYPAEWLSQVTFRIDSAENVDRNYEGNYSYRLR